MVGECHFMRAKVIAALLLGIPFVQAAEWPGYRGGVERRAFSAETFPQGLKRAWTLSAHAPTPAWPKPARRSYWQQLDDITARVTDDHGYHPVMAEGYVLFASSADDHLYCVRADTGEQVWRVGADGPLRYAPYVSDGRVFFGGDDGLAYCLVLRSGRELWRRRLSDSDLRIPGNGRMISSWPIRTGCLVHRGRVYFSSGLYPQQGAWVWALDTDSGEVEWQTQIDASPQGYLLASSTQLFVPTGRGLPLVLDLSSGEQVAQLQSLGGTFAVIDDGVLLSGPGNDGSLSVADSANGARLSSIKGKYLSVGERYSVLVEADELVRLDRSQFLGAARERKKWNDTIVSLQARQKQTGLSPSARDENRNQLKIAAANLGRAEEQLLNARHVLSRPGAVTALVAMKDVILLGGQDRVEAVSVESGNKIWETSVSGSVVGLALSDGVLVVTTASGTLECFASGNRPAVRPELAAVLPQGNQVEGLLYEPVVRKALREVSVSRGYVVLIGKKASRFADIVSQESELKSVLFLSDKTEVRSERSRWMGRGLYGTRASVHWFKGEALPLVGDVAALVVFDSTGISSDEATRLARPHGGVVLDLKDGSVLRKPGTPGEGSWTHLYGNPANTAASRDQLASSDLVLQWFGGVGPSRMVDRHLRGSAPLCDEGILVVPGEDLVIGMDAYSGEELWERPLPQSQRYSMPYDAGYMALDHKTLAVAVSEECWMVDTESGILRDRLRLPKQAKEGHWGYVAFQAPGRVVGTWQAVEASRMSPSRERVDADYRDEQALVCGRGLFVFDVEKNSVIWSRPSNGIVNPTLTSTEDSVFWVEFLGRDDESKMKGRWPLATIVNREPQLVAVDAADGQTRWRVPVPEKALQCRNILYLAYSKNRLVLVGSYLNQQRDTTYEVFCFSAANGSLLWSATHDKGKPGETFHGEQMHHPVLVGNYLITEPVVYDMQTGQRVSADGQGNPWRLSRPGHSCGTISASEQALYFRAGNPTALELSAHLAGNAPPRKLSPTRPGCWINITGIP